jgi:hypothetical protein
VIKGSVSSLIKWKDVWMTLGISSISSILQLSLKKKSNDCYAITVLKSQWERLRLLSDTLVHDLREAFSNMENNAFYLCWLFVRGSHNISHIFLVLSLAISVSIHSKYKRQRKEHLHNRKNYWQAVHQSVLD